MPRPARAVLDSAPQTACSPRHRQRNLHRGLRGCALGLGVTWPRHRVHHQWRLRADQRLPAPDPAPSGDPRSGPAGHGPGDRLHAPAASDARPRRRVLQTTARAVRARGHEDRDTCPARALAIAGTRGDAALGARDPLSWRALRIRRFTPGADEHRPGHTTWQPDGRGRSERQRQVVARPPCVAPGRTSGRRPAAGRRAADRHVAAPAALDDRRGVPGQPADRRHDRGQHRVR